MLLEEIAIIQQKLDLLSSLQFCSLAKQEEEIFLP
jgi:hypothetical protein